MQPPNPLARGLPRHLAVSDVSGLSAGPRLCGPSHAGIESGRWVWCELGGFGAGPHQLLQPASWAQRGVWPWKGSKSD